MKSLHAFAIVCLLPLGVLTAVAIAAATTVPTGLESRATETAAPTPEPRASQDPVTADDKAKGAEDGMHEHMEVLQAGMREMRRMLGKDEQKADMLALLKRLQGSALACFPLVPVQAEPPKDEAAGAEWRIGYQRRMVTVYDTLLQLELATYQGDAAKQKELYQELGKQKTTGHEIYQPE